MLSTFHVSGAVPSAFFGLSHSILITTLQISQTRKLDDHLKPESVTHLSKQRITKL